MRNPRRLSLVPARVLWAVWALLLASLFPGCDSNHELQVSSPTDGQNLVHGRVFNSVTGADLSSASVHLVPENRTFVTSATGLYSLPMLVTGEHVLSVSHSGFNTSVQGVLLGLNGALALDIPLVPSTFSGTITGQVVDAATGDPLAGVTVTVPQQQTTVPLPGPTNDQPVATAVTDDTGHFSLGPIGAGRTRVVFQNTTHLTTVASVDVPAGGNTDLVFHLIFASGSLSGTVLSSRASAPLTNALVSIISTPTTTLTNAQGMWSIAPLFAGTYALGFDAPGHDHLELTTSVFTGVNTVTNVTLRFNLARLLGTVQDVNGVPVTSAVVSVPALNATSTTDASGRYDFGLSLHVPANTQQIAAGASANGFVASNVFVTLAPGQSTTQNFVLSTSVGNLIGQVVSQTGGGPIASAQVTIPAINQSRVTDLFGSFTFFAIPAIVEQVNVTAAGHTSLTTQVPVFSNRTSQVTLLLSP